MSKKPRSTVATVGMVLGVAAGVVVVGVGVTMAVLFRKPKEMAI